jgi:hypothetical protein
LAWNHAVRSSTVWAVSVQAMAVVSWSSFWMAVMAGTSPSRALRITTIRRTLTGSGGRSRYIVS